MTDQLSQYTEVKYSVPLPNPATLNIGGVLVYFQIFYIKETPQVIAPTTAKVAKPGPAPKTAPLGQRPAKSGTFFFPFQVFRILLGVAAPRKIVVSRKPYSQMIEEALRHYGGKATYKEIKDYISQHFKEEVADRKTWQNSVAGVLSSNPLFESAPLDPEDSSRWATFLPLVYGQNRCCIDYSVFHRGRGSMWTLLDFKPGEKATTDTPAPTNEGLPSEAVDLEEPQEMVIDEPNPQL